MFSVHVENSFSDKALIICGVPQGSIFGPHMAHWGLNNTRKSPISAVY